MTRSVDPLFDPRLADWLEEDETTAPDQALDIVLASFPSIKQRRAVRVPWRTPTVTSNLRLGLAAAIVVAAAIGGIYFLGSRSDSSVAGPETPQPSPPPSESAAAEQSTAPNLASFTSPLYGYTIGYPAPYSAVPATEAWTGEDQLNPEAAFADRFFAPNGNIFVLVAALPQPPNVTDEEFMASYQQQVADRECAVPRDAWTAATVAGVPAQRAEFECGETQGLEMIWIANDTGFAISGDAAVVDVMAQTFALE